MTEMQVSQDYREFMDVQNHAVSLYEQSSLTQSLIGTVRLIGMYVFELPIWVMYLKGPSFFGVGFWENKDFDEICSELTRVSNQHWQHAADECRALIYQRFASFLVMFYVTVYFMVFWKVWYCILTLPFQRRAREK